MKEIIGKVVEIREGVFSVKGANGNIKTLNVGDEVLKNEIVYGEAINTDDSLIEIKLVNNEGNIVLTGEQEVKFDSSLTNTIIEEVAFNKEDITALETASGQEESEEQYENSFKATFNVRDGDLTNIESDLRDTTVGADKKKEVENITLLEEKAEKSVEPEPEIPLVGKILLVGNVVIEGEDITVTATVDNAPKTDLIITLNNGEQITIKANETQGTVTYNSRPDDFYKQGDEVENISIVNTKGGNFEKLDTTATAKVTVKDDYDVTTVSVKQSSIVSYKYQIQQADKITDKTGKIGTVKAYDNKQYNISDKYPDVKVSLLDGVIKVNDKGELYFTYAIEIDKPLDVALQVNARLTGSTSLPDDSLVDGIKKNLIIAPGETKITFDFYFKELIEHEDNLIQQAKDLLSNNEITKEQYDNFFAKMMGGRLEHSVKEDVYSNDKFFIQNNFISVRYDPESIKELLDNTPDEKTKADLKSFYGIDAYLEDWDGETVSNMTIQSFGDSKVDTTTIDFEVNFKPPYELEIKAISSNPSYFANNSKDIISDWNSNYKDLDVHFVFKDIITGKKYNATVKLDDEFLKEGISKIDLSKIGVYVNGKYEVGHFSSGNWALEDVSYGWWKQFEDVSFGSFKIISIEEFTYEIETSNIPDPTKYDFVTTFPTVKVETTFINSLNVESKEIYEVRLDKDGKGTLIIAKDSIQKVSDIKVLEVDGNFEKTEIEVIKDDVIYKDITISTKISLDTPKDVIEGEDITVTATVDNAPKTDLIITLNNGEQITIKANETQGTVTYSSRPDDLYKQGDEVENISIANIKGGNFEKLDTTATTKVTVKDDYDVTTVSVTKTQKISYEIENIQASTTTDKTGEAGESNLKNVKYYKASEKVTMYAGGGYKEFISTGQVRDEDIAIKNLFVKDGVIKKDDVGMYVEIVLVLENPAKSDMEFDGNYGREVADNFIIKAGETTGSTKFYMSEKDDVYSTSSQSAFDLNLRKIDNKQVTIKTATGGGYSSNVIASMSTNFKEDSNIDTTQVNLTSEIVGDNIIFKVQTSNPLNLEKYSNSKSAFVSIEVNNSKYNVYLDKDGKGTLTLDINKVGKTSEIKANVIKDYQTYFEDTTYGSSNISINKEITYEIETSNIPDPTKYDFVTTFPTAKVEVETDNKTETYTINLDKNGKGTLTLDTTNLTEEPIIKVVEIDGNFESVDLLNVNYQENQSETAVTDKKNLDLNVNFADDNINLANLTSIIENKELNLKNGIENKLLNISLEDVLKLSPEKLITIKGDEFDKVTFKNTVQDGVENNWSKTVGTGADSGYDVYVNSGDLGVQVKVEQPISDGITS
ncbi:hypothetical protein H0A43_03390 [Arcobacter lanthieri]|uniref:immunoglobulin-like domain-containing protein n=1 Tax=Aliarcobacter lanthieri TaxID=1355374 RepID=UPI001921B8DF|nr:immunoglobulin-like domain-containing protein [Aliarcobacter lanthieri]MBL3519501.1 hypothetical protein [Aliarcobacter lanthieri]